MRSAIVTPSVEPTFVVLDTLVQFLSEPGAGENDLSLMTGSLPPGEVVPLHSHADPEVFYVIEGTMEVYQEENGWQTAEAGQLVTIRGDAKHALRNTATELTKSILVSKIGIYYFFRDLAQPFDPSSIPHPPSPEEIKKFSDTAAKYHHWRGSSADNAALGIALP